MNYDYCVYDNKPGEEEFFPDLSRWTRWNRDHHGVPLIIEGIQQTAHQLKANPSSTFRRFIRRLCASEGRER